jgi:hypothetical protein
MATIFSSNGLSDEIINPPIKLITPKTNNIKPIIFIVSIF